MTAPEGPAPAGVRAAPVATVAPAIVKKAELIRANLAADIQARRERNAMVAQIRGTQWGLGADKRTTYAVANYCLAMHFDPVRHVEVLGGRIYLKAECYEEKAAPLIRSGVLIPHEIEYINVDPRLDVLAHDDDEGTAQWAQHEKRRRAKLRIQYNAPEAAVAIGVKRITIAATNRTVVGVNWCGGGTRKKTITDRRTGNKIQIDADPVGDAEPTKTAETRAGRRAWKQIVDVLPEFAELLGPAEALATELNQELTAKPEEEPPRTALLAGQGADEDPMGGESASDTATVVDAEVTVGDGHEPVPEDGAAFVEASGEVQPAAAIAPPDVPPRAAIDGLAPAKPLPPSAGALTRFAALQKREAMKTANEEDLEELRLLRLDHPDLFAPRS